MIRLPNRVGTRQLKKLFQEACIPAQERGRKIIIADDEGPVYVEGIGVAQRAAVSETTRSAVMVSCLEEEEHGEGYS